MSNCFFAVRRLWRSLTLAHQFALAGGLYTLPAMLLCGLLTTSIVTQAVIDRHAESVAAVLSSALATHGSDSAEALAQISFFQALTERSDFLVRFPYMTVWSSDGGVLYSNIPGYGTAPGMLPRGVTEALAGRTHAQFSDMNSPGFRATGLSVDFLEVFFPLVDTVTGQVEGAVQLRESTASIEAVLAWVSVSTSFAVASTSAVVIAGLYGLVREGSRRIERQQQRLRKRLKHSQELARRYRQLKEEAQRLSRNVTKFADDHLRTIGTDLHDGPAQMLSLAVLQVEQARRSPDEKQRLAVLEQIETALGAALQDMRNIAAGLVLPELEQLTVPEIVEYAIDLHTRRTGLAVNTSLDFDTIDAPPAVGTCAFRFVQEGLNNAFHHGLAEGITVTGSFRGTLLKLSVMNHYLEGTVSAHSSGEHGLGLHGLRARVQSVGGNFLFAQEHGFARIEMWIDLRHTEQ